MNENSELFKKINNIVGDFFQKSRIIRFIYKHRNSIVLQGFLAISIFLALNYKELYFYIINPFVPGGDGNGHMATGLYYAEHIFPRTWGLIPNWFGGMPFPNFYPPFFYWIIAFFYKITDFNYIYVFKFFSISSILLFPVCILWLTRSIFKRDTVAAWSVSILASLTVSFYAINYDSWQGINMRSFQLVGLLPYIFAFSIMILFLRFVFDENRNKKSWIGSTFLFFLVLISNIHVAQFSIVLFLIATFYLLIKVYSEDRKNFYNAGLYYASSILFAILLSMFWYLPMLAEYTFISSINYNIPDYLKYILIPISPGLVLAAFFTIKRDNNVFIYTYTTFILVVIFLYLFQAGNFFPGVTFHFSRWIVVTIALFPIISAYVISNAFRIFPKMDCLIKIPVFSIIIFLVLNFYYIGLNDKNIFYKPTDQFKNNEIVEYVDNYNDGERLFLVERASLPIEPLIAPPGMTLESILGINNKSAWAIYREPSISNIFYSPLKNVFFPDKESFGVRSFLDPNINGVVSNFNSDFSRKIDFARFFGITDIFVTSPEALGDFLDSELVTLEKDFGYWKLFSLNDISSRVETLSHKPILLFSKLYFKERGSYDYNFIRFQELVVQNLAFDIIFVSPKEKYIEKNDFSKFDVIVLEQYEYKNFDDALIMLNEFSERSTLILYETDNPLFYKLNELDKSKHKISVVKRVIKPTYTQKDLMNIHAGNLFEIIRNGNSEILEKPQLESVFDGEKILVNFIEDTEVEVPVLIKSTYAPKWTEINNKNIYLSTPTFMLVFSNSDIEMNYVPDNAVKLGFSISIISFIIIILLLLINPLLGITKK
ncbi:MAG TPA: hypothetical protein PKA60_00740 [Candidatus Paceibacterota bacterium]|nr:hypothetical protein [Candidatus Paceibacterota bacterium]